MADDTILETRGLTKEFKGFVAVNDVSLRDPPRHDPRADRPERRRQDHLLQPAHPLPDADARARSSSTAARSPARGPATIARMGLVRSFQISAVFPHLTVLENVRIALQRKRGHSFDFWRSERVADAARRPGARADRRRRPRRSSRDTPAVRAAVRPQARARDRDHAGARPGDDAARRADGRHDARGRRAHRRADQAGRRRTARC